MAMDLKEIEKYIKEYTEEYERRREEMLNSVTTTNRSIIAH